MKASRIVTSINKPLATKEAAVVNVCPEALAPAPAFRFSFCLLSADMSMAQPGALSTWPSTVLHAACFFPDADFKTWQ